VSATDSIPPQLEMLNAETLLLVCDFTPLLASGEVLTAPVCTLTQIDTGASFAAGLSGAAGLASGTGGASKAISQIVTGLIARRSYILEWQGTVASNKILAQKTRLDCPF
jgi:hypothetical protein